MTSATDVVELLGRLDAAGLWYCVEGGWGVDALLGDQRRPHSDLDLGVDLEQVETICAALSEFVRDEKDWPGSLVLTDGRGRKLDLHPLELDANGNGWQANMTGGSPYCWPSEGMAGRGTIAGRGVRCITPELQLRWHVYADYDDLDWEDATALSEHFGLELPPEIAVRPGRLHAKRG